MSEYPKVQVMWKVVVLTLIIVLQQRQACAESPGRAFLDHHALYDGWYATYGQIKSIRFKYCQEFVEATGKEHTTSSVKYSHYETIIDGPRFLVRRCHDSKEGFTDPSKIISKSFDGKVGKDYDADRKLVIIQKGPPVFSSSNIDTYLGNTFAQWKYLSEDFNDPFIAGLKEEFPEGMPTLTWEYRSRLREGKVRVRPDLEEVSGEFCHVLEIGPDQFNQSMTVWMAHEKGMLPMRIDLDRGPTRKNRMQIEVVGSVMTELGEIWFPKVGRAETVRPLLPGRTVYEVRVDEYVPHIRPAPDAFDLKYPDGTHVVDEIAGIEYVQGREVERAVEGTLDKIGQGDSARPTSEDPNSTSPATKAGPFVSSGGTSQTGPVDEGGTTPPSPRRGRTGWILVLGSALAAGAVVVIIKSRQRR